MVATEIMYGLQRLGYVRSSSLQKKSADPWIRLGRVGSVCLQHCDEKGSEGVSR